MQLSCRCVAFSRMTLLRRRATVLLVSASLSWMTVPANAQSSPALTVESEIQTSEVWRTVPRASAGFVVGHHGDSTDAPVFYTIQRDGRRDEFQFTFDGARGILIDDYAVAPNGEIAVVGGAYTSAGRWASFVARISPDRQRRRVTRVWPFCPLAVTIAADGSIWGIGRLKNEAGTQDLDEPILRRYDGSGAMLTSARVPAVRKYYSLAATRLLASSDRVGWFTTTLSSSSRGEYIEFSLEGREIGRYDGPEGISYGEIGGVALSPDNQLIVGIVSGGEGRFITLDRSSGTWTVVSMPDPAPLWLAVLGFDGETLVTAAEAGRLRRFKAK